MLSVMLFISVGCCCRLAEMHISVARDMDGVSLYDIAFTNTNTNKNLYSAVIHKNESEALITKYFVRSYIYNFIRHIGSHSRKNFYSYVRRAQSRDVILTMRCSLELLYVRHGYSSLSLFTRDELVHAISYLSTS